MFQLAERVNRISVSPTLAVLSEAERYKARGVDVVDFGPGEPDFPTPEHIKRAAIRAIEQNFTKYTPAGGIAPLREAVCAWHAAQFGSAYKPGECIVSVGGKHAIFNAINALIEPGNEVLIPAPYWVSFPDIVKYAGGRPVFVVTEANDGFRLRAAQVEAAITPRTRLVIANSPNNPTGAVIPPDEFARIFEVCRKHGVWLLSDECYSHFLYGNRPYSVASIPGSKPHLVVIGSLSKTFSMTGWRIGYALAPEPLVDAMLKLQSQSTSNPTSIAQYAALEALRGPMDSVGTMLAEYARRRARILEGLGVIPGLTCNPPEGAFYVFPNVRACAGNGSPRTAPTSALPDTTALARQLLEREHLVVVPGEAFGAPGFLRISYATSLERIEEGLRRLARFFHPVESSS
ncbi:MAG TPA: pyridoxal phosphate-dependent aminotransferase [Candidatus Acidoferrales bacterium]|nr:pyridoxal phosphate-dependent aminotransferase [Candidatus Acidoferrales bacterium]